MRFATPLLLLMAMVCGCTASRQDPADFVKPSVAVMKFENRAPFPMHWDLGGGTRDILVDRLMRTDRYHVIERPELSHVVSEQEFQHSGMTRPQEKVASGRIKNIQYLIKGVVTDFSQVSGASGHVRNDSFGLFSSGSQAIVSIILYVVDVESGEIITSESIEESVAASDVSVDALYKGVTFGGSAFYRTPLGKAMNRVVDRAVMKITQTIANRRWSPRIAEVQADGAVLLTGGTDRALHNAMVLEVLEEGAPVVDPETGDVLGRRPPQVVGTIQITQVMDRYSAARPLSPSSRLKAGQLCRPAAQPN